MKRILIFFLLLCLVFVFLIYPMLIAYFFKTLVKNELSRRFKGMDIEVKVDVTPFFIFSSQFDKVEGRIISSPYVNADFEFIKFQLDGVKVKVRALLSGRSPTNSVVWKSFVLSGGATVEQANSFIESQGFPLRIETNNGKILASPLGIKLPWLFGDKEQIVIFDPKEKERSLENLLKLASEGFSVDLDQVALKEIKVSAGRIEWALEIKARDSLALQNFLEGFQ